MCKTHNNLVIKYNINFFLNFSAILLLSTAQHTVANHNINLYSGMVTFPSLGNVSSSTFRNSLMLFVGKMKINKTQEIPSRHFCAWKKEERERERERERESVCVRRESVFLCFCVWERDILEIEQRMLHDWQNLLAFKEFVLFAFPDNLEQCFVAQHFCRTGVL